MKYVKPLNESESEKFSAGDLVSVIGSSNFKYFLKKQRKSLENYTRRKGYCKGPPSKFWNSKASEL
jgi:hypothetical protein